MELFQKIKEAYASKTKWKKKEKIFKSLFLEQNADALYLIIFPQKNYKVFLFFNFKTSHDI